MTQKSGKVIDVEHPDYLFAKEVEHIISLEITNSIGDVETVKLEAYYESSMLPLLNGSSVKFNSQFTKDTLYRITEISMTAGWQETSIVNIEARRIV